MSGTDDLIKGLLIFQRYTDDKNFAGGAHEVVYAYPTSRPIPREEVAELIKMGWFQSDVVFTGDDGNEMRPEDYSPEENWQFYT